MWILWLAAAGAADDAVAVGRELFVRTWEPYDPRAGGDGLGPMFNARSCVACHVEGGVGGGGGNEHDVMLIAAPQGGFQVQHKGSTLGPTRAVATNFRRNTPALFGAGLIDAIPESALRRAAEQSENGRLSLLADGRIGRFGWKGHAATLTDFVGTACAVELGLEVPGHTQAPPPTGDLGDRAMLVELATERMREQYGISAEIPLDMTALELAALTTFVAKLPRPQEKLEQPSYARGRELFDETGCASCHVPSLGGVEGLYSDLLLHHVGGTDPAATYSVRPHEVPVAASPPKPSEWRTPPLWGVGSSSPYMHDGRAPTLDAAILEHMADAKPARDAYLALPHLDKLALTAFLESLVAPGT